MTLNSLPNYKRIRSIYSGMKSRCSNPKMPNYKYYGAAGVRVCDEWQSSFVEFYEWAMSNGYEEGLTLDRIDSCGNYEPSNCRWVSMKVQDNNRKNNILITYSGEIHTIPEWAEKTGLEQHVIRNRLKRKWSIEETLTRKAGKYGN